MKSTKFFILGCFFFIFLYPEDDQLSGFDGIKNGVETQNVLPDHEAKNSNEELNVKSVIGDLQDREQEKHELHKDAEGVEGHKREEPNVETIDLPEEKIGIQGNWVKKREWLKESYKVNEEIQQIVSDIQNLVKPFRVSFQKIDEELDIFYKQEGLKQGSINSLFNSVDKYLNEKKIKLYKKLKTGVTSPEEIKIDLFLNSVKQLKKKLKQLKLDVKSIDELDKSINIRFKKLDEYTKKALDGSIKSKELVDEIWYIIDDLKARDIYYKLKGDFLEKVMSIKSYLAGTFLSDFNNLLNLIREQIKKTSDAIEKLEKDGLIIRKRSERLEKIRLDDLDSKKTSQKEVDKAEHKNNITFFKKGYNCFINTIIRIHNFLSEI